MCNFLDKQMAERKGHDDAKAEADKNYMQQ